MSDKKDEHPTEPGTQSADTPESKLLEALAKRDLATARRIICDEPNLNLNCIDHDELSPLQHACHIGDLELARLLINNGASVNYTQRKDRYTALMFAAISAKADIVRLLLERGVDITAENCVNRTAADMAAFVGQAKIVSIINCWIPYSKSIEPYTRKRELEDEPRLPSKQLGHLLHNYIVYPTYHPVKFMLFIKENLDLVQYGPQVVYVLDNLCSKATQPSINDETMSLKYHYLSHILQYCIKAFDAKKTKASSGDGSFDRQVCEKAIETAIRRLIRIDNPDTGRVTPQINRFIIECLFKFPYQHLAIFKTASYALSKLDPADLIAYTVLIQVLNGPRIFGRLPEDCAVCRAAQGVKNRCSRCKSVFYCDQSCQKADWFQHKKWCESDR